MKLMGRWNWWAPRPLRRFHSRFGLRGEAGDVAGTLPADRSHEPVA
jgi:RND superfamily putative drug exporter